jgi:hypothetical protein
MDAVAKKYDLVVLGNKRKALEPEIDSPPPKDTQLLVTKLLREASRAPPREKSRPRKRVKSKKFVSDDEDEVLEDKVIYVKVSFSFCDALSPICSSQCSKNRNVSRPFNPQVGHRQL